jgi:hypothetical protein
MSATAFIRRPTACDILVEFNRSDYPNHRSAWQFCQAWLRSVSENTCPEAEVSYDYRGIGSFWQDQIVAAIPAGTAICYELHDGFPEASYSATYKVNPRGTVRLTQQEALLLSPTGEPDGFIPFESEGIWSPERRTREELDDELDNYAAERYAEEKWIPAAKEEEDLSWPTDDEEPCTFGMQRGICRCCGELTVEPDFE